MTEQGTATPPQQRAAIHIELADVTVKSVTLKKGKAIWVLECDASNQSTNLPDIETVQDEGYRSQVVMEAAFEESDGDSPDQMRIEDWSKDGGGNTAQ